MISIIAINSLIVTNANPQTAKNGSHLKDVVVEESLKNNNTQEITAIVGEKTVFHKALEAETSKTLLQEEIKLQETKQKEKVIEQIEQQQKISRQVIVDKLNRSFTNKLTGYGEFFYNTCNTYGVDPYLAAAITLFETGHATSALAVNNNNFGGMRTRGGWMSFASVEAGIDAHIRNLANLYIAYGLTTPETMVNKYAEGSQSWVSNINTMYSYIINN